MVAILGFALKNLRQWLRSVPCLELKHAHTYIFVYAKLLTTSN